MNRVWRNSDEDIRDLARRAVREDRDGSEFAATREGPWKEWIAAQLRIGAFHDLAQAREIVSFLADLPGSRPLFLVMRAARQPSYRLNWAQYGQTLGQAIPDMIPHVQGPRYTWDTEYEFPGVVTLTRSDRHRVWISGHHTDYWVSGTPMWDGSEYLSFELTFDNGESHSLLTRTVPWSGIPAFDAAVWEHFARLALIYGERQVVDRLGMNPPSSSDERAREAERLAALGDGPAALAVAAEAVRRADPQLIVPTRFFDPYQNMRIAGFFFQGHSQPFLDVYLTGNKNLRFERRSGPRSRTRGGRVRPRERDLPEHLSWSDDGSQWTFSAISRPGPADVPEDPDESYTPFMLQGMTWPPPDYWWALPQVQQWARTFAARQVPIVGSIRDRALGLLGPELEAIRAREAEAARRMPVRVPYPSSSFSVYGDGRRTPFHFNMPAQLRERVPDIRRIVEEEAARRGWRFVVHRDVVGGSNYVLEGRFPDA